MAQALPEVMPEQRVWEEIKLLALIALKISPPLPAEALALIRLLFPLD